LYEGWTEAGAGAGPPARQVQNELVATLYSCLPPFPVRWLRRRLRSDTAEPTEVAGAEEILWELQEGAAEAELKGELQVEASGVCQ
jgi:hypothetical protein